MQCGNSMQRSRSKSRNQRKRERMRAMTIALVTVAVWVAVGAMMFKAWANEPTISAAEHQAYIASLQGGER